jgi:endonuclease-3
MVSNIFTEKEIDFIFTSLNKSFINPTTELNYTNEYTLLVAVVLSAQTTDVSVNKATAKLFQIAQSPEKMINLGEGLLKEYIKGVGLYSTKAKNILTLSKILIEKFNSEVPNNFEDLIKLPGVGRKTANVVLNCLFQKPTIAIDTHVFRVSNRVGLVNEKTIRKTEEKLLQIVPKKWLTKAHNLLVLHGRYICKTRKPLCEKCNIKEYCHYFKNNILL